MTFSYPRLLKYVYNSYESRLDIKDKSTLEVINKNIVVDKYNLFCHYLHRPLYKVKEYLFGELSWYLSGERKINNIIRYSKFWKKIINKNNQVNSNYGNLIFYKKNKYGITQFEWCKNQLKKDINSRQALILYNDKNYYYNDNKDFICTQLQHFFIRKNILVSIIYIRSSDMIFGLTYDIPWWSIVQQQLYLSLIKKYPDLKIGKLFIYGGSFHIYSNKFQLVKNMFNFKHMNRYKIILRKIIPLNKCFEWYEKNLDSYIKIINNKNNFKIA